MLITRLKSEETITSLCSGKVFIINCHGCKCCEYICSSKIPLVSKINAAKGLVMPLLKKK